MDEPTRRLAPNARWVWRLQQVGFWGVLTIVTWAFELPWAPAALFAVLLLATAVVPELRWRRWRWDIRDDGIDIRHGTFTVKRTLVPWLRVQHVDTRRGLLEQGLDLATVVVHTAAGSHTIPLLDAGEAALLRDRIAGLARTDADA